MFPLTTKRGVSATRIHFLLIGEMNIYNAYMLFFVRKTSILLKEERNMREGERLKSYLLKEEGLSEKKKSHTLLA